MLSVEQLENIEEIGHNLIEVLKCKSPEETLKKLREKINKGDLSNLYVGDYIPFENGKIVIEGLLNKEIIC